LSASGDAFGSFSSTSPLTRSARLRSTRLIVDEARPGSVSATSASGTSSPVAVRMRSWARSSSERRPLSG
jgi:hypothetical protein